MTVQALWHQVVFDKMPKGNLKKAMQKAVTDLEKLTQRSFYISQLQIKLIPLTELSTYAEEPTWDVVAVFLHLSDDLPGWALFTIPLRDACLLVDCLLDQAPGTTFDLAPLAISALAEMGNVVLASFVSELSTYTGVSIRPSPPSVVVDRLATILEISAVTVSTVTDQLLVIETSIKTVRAVEQKIQIRFWVLPDHFAFQFDPESIQQLSLKA